MAESDSVRSAGPRPLLILFFAAAFAAALSLALAAAPAPVQSAAKPARSPTFHSGVSLVLVDVVVRDNKTGKLVTDLKKSDFSLDDQGTPQQIATFASINLPIKPAQSTQRQSRPARSARVTTNGAQGRIIVFLVDDQQLPFEYTGYVRDLLHRYVNGHMADDDEVAIWTLSDLLARQGFTTDRARLDKIIDRFQGTSNLQQLGVSALATLDNIVTALGRINGRRKVVVYLGKIAAGAIGHPVYEDTLREAAAGDVAIYPVSPIGVTGNFYLGLNILADETGGRVFDRNDFDYVLDRLEEEAGTYYMLGFTPTETDTKPGHLRRIHVKVDRPDVSILVRTHYVQIPKDQRFNPETASLADVVESALPMTDLTLRADAVAFAGTNGRDQIVVTMSADGPASRLDGHLLRYALVGLDQHGEVIASDGGASRIPAADFAPAISVVSTLELQPGMRTVKVALRSDDGLVGSVFLNIDVPKLASGELTLSDVAIASPAERTLVIGSPPAFLTTKLPHPPTLTRQFAKDGSFEIYGEVYGSPKAKDVTALATIHASGGAVRRRVDLELEALPPLEKSDRERFRYERGIDLYGLANGDYTLEIDASDQAGHTVKTREPFSIGASAEAGGERQQ